MKTNKIIAFVIALSFILHSCAFTGSSLPVKAWPSVYTFGLIYTSDNNGSLIRLFNYNNQEVFNKSLPYLNMVYGGFSNAIVYDNMIFMAPQGNSQKLNFGKVISLSLVDGSTAEYDFNRINILSCGVDEQYIYSASNLNMTSYVDRWNRHTSEIETLELPGVIVSPIVPCCGTLFGISIAEDIYSFCSYNFEDGIQNEILKFEPDRYVEFLISEDKFVWFTDGSILYCYDTEKEIIDKTELSRDDGYNIMLAEDKIFIAYTDIHGDDPSTIECIDRNNKEVLFNCFVPGPILQMECSDANGSIYLLGYDAVYHLDSNGELWVDMALSGDTLYCGGMFVS